MKIDFLKNCVNFISAPVISKNERIAHPLAVKVAAVALAIFTCGIFALASIGYTLYQQYKAKQVIKPAVIEESDDQENTSKEIFAFVQRFLHPYITGQITEANDDPDRKPLIELLKEEFEEAADDEEIDLEEEGLKAYLEVAAMGLYVNRAYSHKFYRNKTLTSIKSEDPEFQILKDAVLHALPKDFPDLKLTEDAIEQKINDALIIANKRRVKSLPDPLPADWDAEAKRDRKATLLESGELFL